MLYYTILYYTILYYTILYYTILYSTTLYGSPRLHLRRMLLHRRPVATARFQQGARAHEAESPALQTGTASKGTGQLWKVLDVEYSRVKYTKA